MLQVFAALGTEESGATREEVIRRTGFLSATVQDILPVLVSIGCAKAEKDRYYPLQSQFDLFGLGEEAAFHELIQQYLVDLCGRSRKVIREKDSLAFYSALSIQSWRLPEFRKDLKDALFEVMDRYQDDRGDRVQQVFVAFHGSP